MFKLNDYKRERIKLFLEESVMMYIVILCGIFGAFILDYVFFVLL